MENADTLGKQIKRLEAFKQQPDSTAHMMRMEMEKESLNIAHFEDRIEQCANHSEWLATMECQGMYILRRRPWLFLYHLNKEARKEIEKTPKSPGQAGVIDLTAMQYSILRELKCNIIMEMP